MTLLAFAAQLTAAILYSSAVYCVLYNNCTVPYNNSTIPSTAAALLIEHLDSARDIHRVEIGTHFLNLVEKKIGIESSF